MTAETKLMHTDKKIAVVVVAYNASDTLVRTLRRIPPSVWDRVAEVCVFDDASQDDTYAVGQAYKKRAALDKLSIFRNAQNQGYGGNQKLAYRYAIARGHDIAVLLHGDGQYAPEEMMRLIDPLQEERAEAVMGSRMLEAGRALKGGMPVYKYLGNRVLTEFENALLNQKLSEYHSGYRAYDLNALRELPLERNTDDFHFDTQILIQLIAAGKRILEVPIPTFYGDEVCHVDGFDYAGNVASSVFKYKLHTLGLRHAPEYDLPMQPSYPARARPYEVHERIAARIPPGARVLEVGCREGHLSALLAAKGCTVDGVDDRPGKKARRACRQLIQRDPETLFGAFHPDRDLPQAQKLSLGFYDRIVVADVLEHLRNPRVLLQALRPHLKKDGPGRLLASTGNVAHWFIRLHLLAGSFQYTPRGILDSTHLRLYTQKSFAQLLRDSGYAVCAHDVTVLPLEELHPALERGTIVQAFQNFYYRLARLWPGMMAYQFIMEAVSAADPLDDVLAQREKEIEGE
jgi:glycosyltransferase involved in cell wall biosynthesis